MNPSSFMVFLILAATSGSGLYAFYDRLDIRAFLNGLFQKAATPLQPARKWPMARKSGISRVNSGRDSPAICFLTSGMSPRGIGPYHLMISRVPSIRS